MLPVDLNIIPGGGKDIPGANAEAGLISGIQRLNGPLGVSDGEESRDGSVAQVVGAGFKIQQAGAEFKARSQVGNKYSQRNARG